MTPDNHKQLLERVRRKSKREVERLVAELEPKPDVPAQMRKLPQRAPLLMAADDSVRAPLTHVLAPTPTPSPPVLTSANRTASATSTSTPTERRKAVRAFASGVTQPTAANLAPTSTSTAHARATLVEKRAVTQPTAANLAPTSTSTVDATSTLVEKRTAVRAFASAVTEPTTQEANVVEGFDSVGDGAFAMRGASETDLGRLPNGEVMSSPSSARVAAARAPEAPARASVLEAPREKRATCLPLAPGRYRLQLTATEALHDKLEQLQHLLRHQVPNGDLAVIVERAVDLLLRKTLKERFAQSSSRTVRPDPQPAAAGQEGVHSSSLADQPRTSAQLLDATAQPHATGSQQSREPLDRAKASQPITPARQEAANVGNSRYIPRAVRRQVFARDSGQCTFVADNGKRCSEQSMLELHHVVAFARGGCTTVENIKLMCRPHNALLAERDFGPELIRQKRHAAALDRRE